MTRVFREGHRTFYLAALIFAAVAMAFWGHWIGTDFSLDALPSRAMPMHWHAHEMIFGYGGAVLAGIFLASPPKKPGALFFVALAGLWLAGRLALAFSATLPAPVVALIDLSFGIAVMARMAVPMMRSFKLQTLNFLVIFALHWLADLAMHLDWMGVFPGIASKGALAGLMACATMNASFGGKLTAGLTRNAMVHRGETALPRNIDSLDTWGPILTALCVPAAFLPVRAFGAVLILAGTLNLFRLMAWRSGWVFKNDALLAGFHLGFLSMGLGVYLMGLSAVTAMEIYPQTTHLLAIGAVAGLSLSVMVKMSLGQAGRPARAGAILKLAGGLLLLSLALRVGFGDPRAEMAAALAFALAYALALVGLAPALLGARLQPGTPGARPLGHGLKIKDPGEA